MWTQCELNCIWLLFLENSAEIQTEPVYCELIYSACPYENQNGTGSCDNQEVTLRAGSILKGHGSGAGRSKCDVLLDKEAFS